MHEIDNPRSFLPRKLTEVAVDLAYDSVCNARKLVAPVDETGASNLVFVL